MQEGLEGVTIRAIDAWGRITLPKGLLEKLGKGPGLIILPWWGRSLALFSQGSFEKISERLEEFLKREESPLITRCYTRVFFGNVYRVSLDGRGRICIGAELRRFAGLSKKAVLTVREGYVQIRDEEGPGQKELGKKDLKTSIFFAKLELLSAGSSSFRP